jgi:hypothetical protein
MGITMNQRVFKVELFQGDDLDRLAELSSAAQKLKPSALSTGMEDGEYAAAAEAHDEYLAEARTRAVTIGMQPMLRKPYHDLQVLHPPREDNPSDAVLGVNSETFVEPLLLASIVDPPMSDAEKQEFLDSLNHAQFTHLADEALAINRTVFAPKDRLTSSAPSPRPAGTSVSADASA